MKVDAPTRIWAASVIAAASAIAVCGTLRAFGVIGSYVQTIVFIVAMGLLVWNAIRLAQSHPRLNLTIAAESVVALGIFSLIISIAVALFFMKDLASKQFSFEEVGRISVPFVEGLFAAAVAPIVAVLLRHFEVSYIATESGETGMTEAAHEATGLAKELQDAAGMIAGFNRELSATKGAFDSAFKSAIASAGSLAAALETEAGRIRFALQRVQAEATALSDASEKSRSAVSAFGTGMSALSGSANEARELLDALGKLIESVERYIRPDR